MSRPATLHRSDTSGPAHLSLRDVARSARVYLLDEVAMTRGEVMSARGWDQRRRQYRRQHRP